MTEARNFLEGSLRWVQASATGKTWQTASAAPTGLIGYVQVGFAFTQTRNNALIKERGIPDHWKLMGYEAVQLKIKYLQAVTANYPPTSVTAAGASVPMVHFELKQNMPELGAASATYYQFINAVIGPTVFGEAEQANTIDQTWNCIAMVGPTGSGYLATGGQ